MEYDLEARAETLKGTITLGSREGYRGEKFGLSKVEEVLDKTNVETIRQNLTTIPCIISHGKLVGRSNGNNKYTEGVYKLEFSWSPRSPRMSKEKFYNTLVNYAESMGSKLKQERVYLEFEGETSVLRAKRI